MIIVTAALRALCYNGYTKGKETFLLCTKEDCNLKKSILSTLLALALCLGLLPAAALAAGLDNFQRTEAYAPGTFLDIPAGAWYGPDVQTAYELGLVKGSSADAFSPEGPITVAGALAIACRIHSIYHTGSASFTQGNPWYQVYVDYGVNNGILSAGQFADYNANATRAQFAAILANALPDAALTPINEVESGSLPDVPMSLAGAEQIYRLYRAGVLTGNDRLGTFTPHADIQRSSVATIVTRMADPSRRKSLSLQKLPTMVQYVTLSETQLTLSLDETYREITVTYAPEEAQNKFVNWTSSDPAVATVDSEGSIHVVAAGAADITASTSNGASAVCHVTVTSNKMNVYDFLVNYVKQESYSTLFGQQMTSVGYPCEGQIYASLGYSSSNTDWSYHLCYDEETNKITMDCSYVHISTGKYRWTSSADFTLELNPILEGPYFGEKVNDYKPVGTIYLDPASLAKSTKSLDFMTYSGDRAAYDQEQFAINIKNFLYKLEDKVLTPNGYTLAELGFVNW